MRATKLVSGLKKKCYKERLMEVYKLLTNMYDDNTVQLDINSDTRTRGHTKKLVVRRCRYDVRKYSFSEGLTNPENFMGASVPVPEILTSEHGIFAK